MVKLTKAVVLKFTIVGFAAILVQYFIWGTLDDLGGVNGFFSAIGLSMSQATSNVWGTSCFFSSEGFVCLPSIIVLTGDLIIGLIFLAVLTVKLLQILADADRYEEDKQRKIVVEAIRQVLREERDKEQVGGRD